MKPFHTYLLRCRDGSYYVGHTDDLEKRLSEHHDGAFGGYTAKRRPVELAFHEEFDTREEALERESQLKGWSRAKKEALIDGDWSRLSQLAKGRPSTSSGRTEQVSQPKKGET